ILLLVDYKQLHRVWETPNTMTDNGKLSFNRCSQGVSNIFFGINVGRARVMKVTAAIANVAIIR
ncbi:hypothetical protein, partial [Psychrobacter sp.]|uniref:hypothetical protein n=1 Tax=Psychrobacter sp. TaxID=56811 RepID=UPI003F95723F